MLNTMLFLINLDSAFKRRNHMTSQLIRLGLRFERIGIDLRASSAGEVAALVRATFPAVEFDLGKLSGAEVGCWLSHLSCWKRMRERNAGACTVLEDDLLLDDGLAAAVSTLATQDAFDLVYLGTSSRNLSTRRRTAIGPLWAHQPVGAITKAGGSCTSLEVRADGIPELVKDFVSISGTHTNCAGGSTPFGGGAWLTCEEITQGTGPFVPRTPFNGRNGFNQPHGYVFEVPVIAESTVEAVPFRAMGRFSHEAVVVDPETGIVYQTEDDGDSGFYRFIPNDPNDLAAGGTLQMLAIRGRARYNTRTGQTLRRALPCTWVTISDPDPANAETNSSAVYEQGLAQGGAIFARLEGCWYGNRSVFFTSTSGGDAREGQVWEYIPSGNSGGILRLIFESPSESVLDNPDNICISPRGGIVLCEDGDLDSLYCRGLTRDGRIFDFAQNVTNDTEWAGACFSPDGEILFVNWQGYTRGPDDVPPATVALGRTFAIWGPWENGAL